MYNIEIHKMPIEAIRDRKKVLQIFRAYKLLIEDKRPIEEVAKVLNTSSLALYHDLNILFPLLIKINFSEEVEEMYYQIKQYFMTFPLDFSTTRINLNDLYLEENKQLKFIAIAALTFRLDLTSLSELLGENPKIIYNRLLHKQETFSKSLDYCFWKDSTNQTEAKLNFLSYYEALLLAKKRNDSLTFKTLLSTLSDKDVIAFKNTRKKGSTYKKDDIETILSYQYKYAFSVEILVKTLKIDIDSYRKLLKTTEGTELYDSIKMLNENNKLKWSYNPNNRPRK